MQNIKKYFMTLALLLTAVGGAWAQSSPKVYTTQVSVEDLQVGDILAQGFSLVNNGSEKGFYFDKNRHKLNGGSISSSDWHDLISDITSYGENCTISIRSTGRPDNVFTPVDENGNDGNAWVVTEIDNGIPYISGINFEITEWDLTSKDGKTWTLAKMPASDVELQVEYYAESNLFLSEEALADKANISVLNGSTAVTFDDAGKSANTVTEGNTVTAKFTGTKKILGMKVTKKVEAKTLAEATSEDIGKIAGKDGKIYATKADAEAVATGNAVAMIAYVGTASDCSHGLAIALEDVSNELLSWNNSGSHNDSKTAAEWCSAWNTSKAVTGGTWRLPSISDWQYMFIGCGASGSYSDNPSSMSYSELATKLSTAQGTALLVNTYWSSTEQKSDVAWYYYLTGVPGGFNANWVTDTMYVRACLAF